MPWGGYLFSLPWITHPSFLEELNRRKQHDENRRKRPYNNNNNKSYLQILLSDTLINNAMGTRDEKSTEEEARGYLLVETTLLLRRVAAHLHRRGVCLALLRDMVRGQHIRELLIHLIHQSPSRRGQVAIALGQQALVGGLVLARQDGVAHEQQVDLLEGLAGHLGVDEPDDGHGDDVEDAEDDEGQPAQSVKHDGDDEGVHAAADGPSEDGEGVALGADLLRPDLGAVDPAGDDVEHGEEPEEDEDHGGGGDAEVRGLVARRLLRGVDEGGDEEERDALGDEGDEEGLDAAEPVNHQGGGGGADNAKGVDQTGQPGGLVGVEASQREQGAGPGGNGEDTGPLLNLLEPEAEPDATAEMQIARVAADDHVEEGVTLELAGLDLRAEDLDLLDQSGVVKGQVTTDLGKHLGGLLVAVHRDQPSGGVGQEGDRGDDQQDRDTHDAQGEPPAELDLGLADGKVDPVGEDDAQEVGDEDEREVGAAVVGLGELGHPGRDDDVDEADAQAGDDTRADEHVGVVGGGHERATEEAEGCTDEGAALAAESVTAPAADEAAEHGAEVCFTNRLAYIPPYSKP
jgi:hypothetical protein